MSTIFSVVFCMMKCHNIDMQKAEKILTIEEIKVAVQSVAKDFGLKKVSLFGSYADGNPTSKSDIDLIVEFTRQFVSLLLIIKLKHALEDTLGKSVDIIHAPISDDSFLEITREVSLYVA